MSEAGLNSVAGEAVSHPASVLVFGHCIIDLPDISVRDPYVILPEVQLTNLADVTIEVQRIIDDISPVEVWKASHDGGLVVLAERTLVKRVAHLLRPFIHLFEFLHVELLRHFLITSWLISLVILGKALFHLLNDGQADVAPVSSSMLILHASRVFNIVLEMVDLLSLFFVIIFQLRKVGFDHPGLLLRLLSLCLEIFVLGGENRELDLFLFMESYLLADLQLERLVLYLDIGERRLEVLDADCVFLQLLMVVGFHLLDEVGVHVPDVLQVVADARVHGHDYLLEGVGDDDQELFLVDLVVSVVEMLALVLLDECRVGALGVAEASVYELEAASDGVVFLVRLQWSLLGPEPALLVLSCGKGSRGDVLLLRLV